MTWLSYITSLEIIKVNSSLNGEIKVIESLGKRTLYANNLEQSGGTITEMWRKSISKIKNQKSKLTNCLVLGLGGGTVINTLQKYYPGLKIKVIEYDPVMIEIAVKYFGIKPSPKLGIIYADAFFWVKKAKKKYNLIIFDLYLGKLNPEKARTADFLKDLKKLVSSTGMVLFNAHYQNDEIEYKKLFLDCQKVFHQVELIVSERYSRILKLR